MYESGGAGEIPISGSATFTPYLAIGLVCERRCR